MDAERERLRRRWGVEPARPDPQGAASSMRFLEDPHWRDLIAFHEYFNGDDGAAHQTG